MVTNKACRNIYKKFSETLFRENLGNTHDCFSDFLLDFEEVLTPFKYVTNY